MPSDDKRKERSGLSAVATSLIVLSLLVAYPLSIGPVGWLIIRAGSPPFTRPTFEFIYGPLIWLQDHGPAPISSLLTWYFGLWWN